MQKNMTAAISDGDMRNRANKLPLFSLLFTEASFGGLSLRSCAATPSESARNRCALIHLMELAKGFEPPTL